MLVCLGSQSYSHADNFKAPGTQSKKDIIIITSDENNKMETAKFQY